MYEDETDSFRCLECGRYIVSCRRGPLWLCAYHNPPLYFRIDRLGRVIDFRVRKAASALHGAATGEGE